MGAAMYKPDTGALYLPLVTPEHHVNMKKSPGGASLTKQSSRKKKVGWNFVFVC